MQRLRLYQVATLAAALLAGPPQARAAVPDSLVQALDQRLRVVERLRELDQEAAATRAKEIPAVTASSKDSFSLRSADGAFRLRVGGYTQADARVWFADPQRARVNTFVLRRVRPQLDGTVGKYVEFRLMPDFGGGTTVLQDAWINLTVRPELKLQAGKFKEPVGLERLQSGTALLFVERGLPTHLLPNRDLGLQLYGDLVRGRVSYAIGVFNGVVDAGSGDSDTNDGKDVAVRVFAHPFRTRPASPLRELGLGLAGTLGRQEGALPAYRTPGQVSFFTYTDTTAADGRRLRLTPQAYWYAGRLGLLGEYAVSRQEVRRKVATARLRQTAWQVAASYVLTGEASTYRGVTPRTPFDPEKGQWGALEAAARLHRLTLDRDAFPVFANPARSARTATAWAAGLNWHLSRNAKINLDYEETRFTGGAPAGGDRKPEKSLFHRFQVAF